MSSFLSELQSKTLHEFRLGVQVRLERAYPGRFVLFSQDSDFDFGPFAAAGQCTALARPWEPRLDSWSRQEDGAARRTRLTGWYEVEWGGRALQVVIASLIDHSGSGNDFGWVVADDEEAAREFFLAVCAWNTTVHGEVLVYDGSFSKSRALHEAIRRASFDELVLVPQLKQSLRDDLRRFLSSKDLYARLKIPWKRGLLLVGPPGNGKTNAVRALLNEAALPCLSVKSLRGGCQTPEEHLGEIFERARKTAPCVMVLEDLDCLVDESTRSVLLNELDGFASNEGLIIIATTNHPEKLDRSLLDRPSRFDRTYTFALPAPGERRTYLERWVASLEPELRPSAVILELLVDGSQGFSFAYLKELTLSAMMAFVDSPVEGAMDRIAPQVLEVLRGEVKTVEKTLGRLPVDRPISLRA